MECRRSWLPHPPAPPLGSPAESPHAERESALHAQPCPAPARAVCPRRWRQSACAQPPSAGGPWSGCSRARRPALMRPGRWPALQHGRGGVGQVVGGQPQQLGRARASLPRWLQPHARACGGASCPALALHPGHHPRRHFAVNLRPSPLQSAHCAAADTQPPCPAPPTLVGLQAQVHRRPRALSRPPQPVQQPHHPHVAAGAAQQDVGVLRQECHRIDGVALHAQCRAQGGRATLKVTFFSRFSSALTALCFPPGPPHISMLWWSNNG